MTTATLNWAFGLLAIATATAGSPTVTFADVQHDSGHTAMFSPVVPQQTILPLGTPKLVPANVTIHKCLVVTPSGAPPSFVVIVF